jgi:hypothetical protein
MLKNKNYWDGVVVHEGELIALKRFKDDVKEVRKRILMWYPN